MPATVITVRAAELRPGDVYATTNGRPVGIGGAPLTVTSVREYEHNGRRMVYVEASTGHGMSAAWPGLRTRIMPRPGR